MLLREHIERALYRSATAYFRKDVVRTVPQALPFRDFVGEADYRRALAEQYASADREWLTPVEIYRPHYAEAVARSVVERHDRLYPGEPIQILEIGGGNGTCASGMLSFLRRVHPERFERCRYLSIEISPELAEVQRARLREAELPADRFDVVNE